MTQFTTYTSRQTIQARPYEDGDLDPAYLVSGTITPQPGDVIVRFSDGRTEFRTKAEFETEWEAP